MAKNSNGVSGFLVARGIIGIIFGIVALAFPGITLVTLALFIMLWLVIGGLFTIVDSILNIERGWPAIGRLVLGVLEVGVGAYLVQRPGLTTATLVALVATVLVVEGIMAIVEGFAAKSELIPTAVKTASIVSGILYVIAGIAVWQYPVAGGLAFVWVIALAALIGGTLQIAGAAELKK